MRCARTSFARWIPFLADDSFKTKRQRKGLRTILSEQLNEIIGHEDSLADGDLPISSNGFTVSTSQKPSRGRIEHHAFGDGGHVRRSRS
jgi:hypothetical protein